MDWTDSIINDEEVFPHDTSEFVILYVNGACRQGKIYQRVL